MFYRAFGLLLMSEIELTGPVLTPPGIPDVTIRRENVHALWPRTREENVPTANLYCFTPEKGVSFAISGTDTILVEAEEDTPTPLLSVYILGTCMGVILFRRKKLLLHGSFVTNGREGILLTGTSHAGKSSIAGEFIRRGWKIVTDDIAPVLSREGELMIQSSYPSQKLWQDAVERLGIDENRKTPLWQEERKDKYHVDVKDAFQDGSWRVTGVVELSVGTELKGYTCQSLQALRILMSNMYRDAFKCEKSPWFQQCSNLAGQARVLRVIRPNNVHMEREIVDLIYRGLEVKEA